MRAEANPRVDHDKNGKIVYTNSNAVVAGEVITVAGLGALVADSGFAAGAAGTYTCRGTVKLPIVAGVTIAQGARVYWDVSGNKALLQSTTAFASGDFFVGTAVEAGSAAGGFVEVDLNSAPTASAPSYVVVGYGVATEAAASGTITVAGAQTTDAAFGSLGNGWTAATGGSVSVSRCYVSAEDTVTYNISGTTAGGTAGSIAVQVIRAV